MMIRKIEIETIIGSCPQGIMEDDYLVYGHSDKIRATLLDKNNSPLYSIYSDIVNIKEGLLQNFYFIFDDEDFDKEKKFWEHAIDANFCGIYFLRLGFNTAINDIKRYVDNNVELFVYNTLDDYDLIIVCYGDSFKDIEDKISYIFNKNCFVKDIYNLFMTSYKQINGDKVRRNETISYKVQISFKNNFQKQIENSSLITFEEQLPELSNIDKSYNISGSQNIMLLFENKSVSDLYALYKTVEPFGIFSITSSYRDDFIKSTHLKFLCEPDLNYYNIYKYDNSRKSVENSNDIICIDEGQLDNVSDFYKMQIKRVCYSMNNIYNHDFPDFTFLSLYFGLQKFLDKLSILRKVPYEKIKNSIELYLQTCREILNINKATQIGYYPKQEYICKEAFIPSKLISFYSAFLWEMTKEIVKIDVNHDSNYTFCLKPSFKENVAITCIFMLDSNVYDRLLLVDMPMKYIFNFDIMLFSLCHEASHYNGEIVRCRQLRANLIFKVMFSYLMNVLLKGIEKKSKEYEIYDYFYNIFNNSVNNGLKNCEYKYYSISIKKVLYQTIYNMLVDISYSMKTYFTGYAKLKESVINNADEILLIIKTIKKNARDLLFKNEYIKMINCIIDLFSEVYSDFFAIKYLSSSSNTYIDIICKTYGITNFENIDSDFIVIRVLAIYLSLFKSNIVDIDKIFPFHEALVQYKAYLEGNFGSLIAGLTNGKIGNPILLESLIQYIDECNSQYQQQFKNYRLSKDIYQMMKNKDLNYNIIDNYNKNFREAILQDIEKTHYD